MSSEKEKVVVHLELSRQAAELLYALNRHALKLREFADPEDDADVFDTSDFEVSGLPEVLRAAFIGKNNENPVLSFTEANLDELTQELGTTLWDALN